jgi:hypothetical protein
MQSKIQSNIRIEFELPSLVYESRVEQLILFRDQWQAQGEGGETPFFKGSASTKTGRIVEVKCWSDHFKCEGIISLAYPECSPRNGFGLLTQILEELLGVQSVRVYDPNQPPIPLQWKGISVECDGNPLHFSWNRPNYWSEWVWTPSPTEQLATAIVECDIA